LVAEAETSRNSLANKRGQVDHLHDISVFTVNKDEGILKFSEFGKV